MTVSFRPLRHADLVVVGALVRESFEDRLAPFMTATQQGWVDFIRIALDHPGQFPAQRLHVAELAGEVVGFADFRVPGDGSGFLSYICVAVAARGQGLGRQLFAACVREAGPLQRVGLDVFEANAPARALYESMGFDPGDVQVWWRAPVPADPVPTRPGDPSPVLSALPVALAALDRFGFCELSGTWDGRGLRLGRLGTSVLRLFSPEDFDDAALLRSLVREFPELTDTFGILPAHHQPTVEGAEPFNRVISMTTSDVPRLLGES